MANTGAPPPGWENVVFDFGSGGADFGGFGEGFGESGFSSFFEMLFGGGGGGFRARGGPGGGRAPRQRGRDRESTIRLSLEDMARGGERTLELADPQTGEHRTLKVNIPAGVLPGQRIRLAGQGEPGIGGPAGDLLLIVEAQPHDRFKLEGRDLHVEVPVTPWEAALGGQARVRTLDGDVTIKLPAGSSSGRQIRLRGKGMPSPKDKGDLYATIRIVVPSELSAEERELFEKLAEVSSFDPQHAAG